MLTKVFLTLYNIKLQKFEIIYKNSCHFYLSILGKFQRRLWPVFSQIYFHMQPNLGDIHCCRSWCLIHKPVWSFSHTHSCMHLILKTRLVKTHFQTRHMCTYSCIGTSGKKFQNPHEGVLVKTTAQSIWSDILFPSCARETHVRLTQEHE